MLPAMAADCDEMSWVPASRESQGEEVSFLLMGIPACVTSEGQTAGSLSPVITHSSDSGCAIQS